jgi:hypothetical protein
MSKQGSAGKRKHIKLTVSQTLESRMLGSGEYENVVMTSHNIGL